MLLPLALSPASDDKGGWMFNAFSAAREVVLSRTGVIVVLATTLATLFCIIRLVNLSNSIMDDSRGIGSSISLREIMHPVFMLMCLQLYPVGIRALDEVTTQSAVAITHNIKMAWTLPNVDLEDLENSDYVADFEWASYAAKSTKDNTPVVTGDESTSTFDIGFNNWYKNYEESTTSYVELPSSMLGKDLTVDPRIHEQVSKAHSNRVVRETAESVEPTGWDSAFEGLMGLLNFPKHFRNLFDPTSWVRTILLWGFKFAYWVYFFLIQAFAQIVLCVMALMGPFAIAFSILPRWKDSFMSFIGNYIEVTLWVPFASAVANVVDMISKCCDLYVNKVGTSIGPLSMFKDWAMADTAELLHAAVCLAGIMALRYVPNLVRMTLSLASVDASGFGGAAGGVAVGAAKKAGSVAGGVAKAGARAAAKLI